MDIEKKILHLLYFKDCVIIPGLGGFVSNYLPARMREESQTFLPPAKEIGFNRELVHDDGVFAGYLAKCDNISIVDASGRIDKFVNFVFSELEKKGTFEIRTIGKLSYARTGEMIFKAGGEINFLADSYGLSSFYYKRQEKENPLLRSAIFKHGSKVGALALPGTLARTERQRSLRRVAIALPLLIAISLLPLNHRHGSQIGQNSAGFLPLPSLTLVELTDDSESIKGSNPDLVDIFVIEGMVVEGISNHEPFDRNSYAIVAGSFSTEENADVLRKELVQKGYGPEVWKASNGFYRVVIQAHQSITAAENAIAELKEELSGIEFWILQ